MTSQLALADAAYFIDVYSAQNQLQVNYGRIVWMIKMCTIFILILIGC